MALDNAVIFINNFEYSPKKELTKKPSYLEIIKLHFTVNIYKLPLRIVSSLIPPIFNNKFNEVRVDLLGPLLAVLTLIILLHHGHSNKIPSATSKLSPNDILLGYIIFMPIVTYVFCRVAKSCISLIEIVAILGYSLYGHIFTLVFSFSLNAENNAIFFIGLLIFGGLSTLRIVLILIAHIPAPVLRLIVCSFVSIVQLLLLVFLHFLYMHKYFIYGAKRTF